VTKTFCWSVVFGLAADVDAPLVGRVVGALLRRFTDRHLSAGDRRGLFTITVTAAIAVLFTATTVITTFILFIVIIIICVIINLLLLLRKLLNDLPSQNKPSCDLAWILAKPGNVAVKTTDEQSAANDIH